MKLKGKLCIGNSVRKIFGARAWMNVYADSFIHIHRDQMQWSHNLPPDSHQLDSWRCLGLWHKRYPGATAEHSWLKRMQRRELWLLTSPGCFPQSRLIPIWACWVTVLHTKKNPECYATHLTQHRLNYQLPGTSPVLNTYRVIGKEIHLRLLHPATSCCFKKNTLW